MYNCIMKMFSSKGEGDGDKAVYIESVWQSNLNTN